MFVSNKKWEIPDTLYHTGSLLEYIVKNRGIAENLDEFVQCSKDRLHSPFLMKGMKKAVSRIRAAIEQREPIVIYGDYDADGVTATSVLFLTLQNMGAAVTFYVPDRMQEGYGLNQNAIAQIADRGVKLIITVDTGISAVHEVQYANTMGIDVIITDHHEPPDMVPDAYVILNPKYKPCEYPEANLAGVGVAFKLASALLDRVAEEYLDLVALGTVADLVPLTGENRILVSLGLAVLNQSPCSGITALIQVAGLEGKLITAGHLGFHLGPRINASGRLENAAIAIELLTSVDKQAARAIAEKLDEINKQRQALVDETFIQAEEKLHANPDILNGSQVIVLADERWNHGVIGIVASRLLEKYYRPVALIAVEGDVGKASARSIHNFHMFHALQACEDLLERYGGHAMAAGFTVSASNVERLHDRLNQLAIERLQEEDYIPRLSVDVVLNISEVVREQQQIKEIETLGPFGIGNPHPKALVSGAIFKSGKLIGKDQAHAKFVFVAGSKQLDVVAYRWKDKVVEWMEKHRLENIRFDLVGELSINEWNHTEKPQLILHDCAVSSLQIIDSWERARELEQILAMSGIPSQSVRMSEVGDNQLTSWCEQLFFDGNRINSLRQSPVYIIVLDVGVQNGKFLSCRIPQREDFATAYKLACKRSEIDKALWFEDCGKEGLETVYCEQILEVFRELQFLDIADGKIRVAENPDRRSLDDSVLYGKLHRRALLTRKHISF